MTHILSCSLPFGGLSDLARVQGAYEVKLPGGPAMDKGQTRMFVGAQWGLIYRVQRRMYQLATAGPMCADGCLGHP